MHEKDLRHIFGKFVRSKGTEHIFLTYQILKHIRDLAFRYGFVEASFSFKKFTARESVIDNNINII